MCPFDLVLRFMRYYCDTLQKASTDAYTMFGEKFLNSKILWFYKIFSYVISFKHFMDSKPKGLEKTRSDYDLKENTQTHQYII